MVVIAGVILNVCHPMCFRSRVIHPAGIGTEGELAQLGIDISVSSGHPQRAALSAQGSAVTGFQPPCHHDIDDAANAFCIILDGRIGDDLDLLDGGGRNGLDKLLEVPGQHPSRPSVHEDLVIRGAVQQYFILSVDAEHRHVSENVDEVAPFCLGISLDIIRQLINISRHKITPDSNSCRLYCVPSFRIASRRVHLLGTSNRRLHHGSKDNKKLLHCLIAHFAAQTYNEGEKGLSESP